jgi:DNA repair exonuclease SbcCD nuclease subunit
MPRVCLHRGVLIGDLHFGRLEKLLAGKVKNGLKVQANHLRKCLRYAVSEGFKYVYILGDLFDSPYPTQEEQDALGRVLTDPEFAGLIILAYLGNHDYTTFDDHSLVTTKLFADLTKHSNVRIITEPTMLKHQGVPVWISPWPYAVSPKGPAALCFGHFNLAGVRADNGRLLRESPKNFKLRSKDQWVIGHIHTFQVLYKGRVLYPGNPYQITTGEKPDKGICTFEAEVTGDGYLNFSYQRVDMPPPYLLKTARIAGDKDFLALPKEKNLYYRVVHSEKLSAAAIIQRDDIIRTEPSTSQAANDNEEEVTDLGRSIPEFQITYGLTKFLRAKTKLKKSQLRMMSIYLQI